MVGQEPIILNFWPKWLLTQAISPNNINPLSLRWS